MGKIKGISRETQITLLCSVALCAVWSVARLIDMWSNVGFLLHVDTDSSVRIAQIRAFLAGQSWWDLELKTFGLSSGTQMHWSRLVDLTPAAMILLLNNFMSESQSVDVTSIVYPLLLTVPYAYALIWLTKRLFPKIDILTVGALCCVVALPLRAQFEHFLPGRLDHHNLQLIALLVMLGGMSGQRSFKSGIISACGLVVGMTIGLDAAPVQAAAIGALGLMWALDSEPEVAFIKGFGLGTVALTPLFGLVFIPRPATAQWCDSWTLPLSTIVFGFGLYMLFVAWLSVRVSHLWARLGVAALVGGLTLGTLLWLNPACLNPLPLPKNNILVDRYWMDFVGETKSLWYRIVQEGFPIRLYAIVPLIFGAFTVVFYRREKQWRPIAIFLIATFAAACYAFKFIRAEAAMVVLTVPLIVYLCTTLQENLHFFSKYPVLRLLAKHRSLGKVLISFFPIFLVQTIDFLQSVGVNLATELHAIHLDDYEQQYRAARFKRFEQDHLEHSSQEAVVACMSEAERTTVQKLPPSRMLAGFLSNEYLIYATHHHQMFGGYHRNAKDVLTIMNWLIGSDANAQTGLTKYGVKYLFYCPDYSQFPLMAYDHPDSFIGRIDAGKPPPWLIPVVKLRMGGVVYEIKPLQVAQSKN